MVPVAYDTDSSDGTVSADSLPTGHSSERPGAKLRTKQNVWDGRLVLCIDGVGIRGFSSLFVLEALVEEIAKEETTSEPHAPDSSNSPLFQPADDESFVSSTNFGGYGNTERLTDRFRLCHYFDYICGTSTGGIAAIMLGTMRLTIAETIRCNKEIWRDIVPTFSRLLQTFPQVSTRSRNSTRIERHLKNALEEAYGVDDGGKQRDETSRAFLGYNADPTTMKATNGECQTIVFATQSATKGVLRPYAIRSYSHLSKNPERADPLIPNLEKDTTHISVVDACRATAATPTLFKKVKINSVEGALSDGSLWKVNPAEEVYREIHYLHGGAVQPVRGLLSIGGGRSRDFHKPPNTILKDNTDDMLKKHAMAEGFKYHRIVCATRTEPSLNLGKMIQRLREETEQYCNSELVRERLREWAKFLVKCRRRRAETVEWEQYAGLRLRPALDTLDRNPSTRREWVQRQISTNERPF